MKAEDFLATIEAVQSRLLEREGVFTVSRLEMTPPLTKAQLGAVEEALEVSYPSILQKVYTRHCSSATFGWYLTDAKAAEIGYDVGDDGDEDMVRIGGDIELINPLTANQLNIDLQAGWQSDERMLFIVSAFLPIIRDDAAGDLYCLDYEHEEDDQVPIAALLHDEMHDGEFIAHSFEEFFEDWSKTGFVNRIDEIFDHGIDLSDEDLQPIIAFLAR